MPKETPDVGQQVAEAIGRHIEPIKDLGDLWRALDGEIKGMILDKWATAVRDILNKAIDESVDKALT